MPIWTLLWTPFRFDIRQTLFSGQLRSSVTVLRGKATVSAHLTPREQEILEYVLRGLPTKAIAQNLRVTERCVKWHLTNVYEKLNVSGRIELLTIGLAIHERVAGGSLRRERDGEELTSTEVVHKARRIGH